MEKTKKVICKDIEGNPYEVSTDQLSFRPSVYGIIIQDGKILLSKQWDGYDFPGGGIELGETIEEALVREAKEETGLAVKVLDLISVRNSFFKLPSTGHYVQSLLLYYRCEVTGGTISTEFFCEGEKEYASQAEWIDLKDISGVKFYNSVNNNEIIAKTKEILEKRR